MKAKGEIKILDPVRIHYVTSDVEDCIIEKIDEVIARVNTLSLMEKTGKYSKELKYKENLLDALWDDSELQQAIADYGEWNSTELNKAFEEAKGRVLKSIWL